MPRPYPDIPRSPRFGLQRRFMGAIEDCTHCSRPRGDAVGGRLTMCSHSWEPQIKQMIAGCVDVWRHDRFLGNRRWRRWDVVGGWVH